MTVLANLSAAPLSSRRVYEVWTQIIQDEELYEAMLDGTHRALTGRDLDAEAIEILDRFRAEPGTRWNVENLRFRSAQHVGDTLVSYMPRMVRMLTRGEELWRQDLCYEYLAYHHWKALGHLQLSECERFAAFVERSIRTTASSYWITASRWRGVGRRFITRRSTNAANRSHSESCRWPSAFQ
jgi:hypothetical protein